MKPIILNQNLGGSASILLVSLLNEIEGYKVPIASFTQSDIVQLTMFKDEEQANKNIQELLKENYLFENPSGLFVLTEAGLKEAKTIRSYERSMYWADV